MAQNIYSNMDVEFPDIESIRDLENELLAISMQRKAIDSYNQEQEEFGDEFEDYDMEEYAKAVEDQTWLSNVARGTREQIQSAYAGAMMQGIDFGDWLRENPAVSAFLAMTPGASTISGGVSQALSLGSEGIEAVSGFDSRLPLQHYYARQKEQDRIRKAARDKEVF